VVASGVRMSCPDNNGAALLSEITEGAAGAGRTISWMGFESDPDAPGF
jgi:hypothetical protein